jgi:DNA-binding winged helix-turn-helix (wHTH) protein
VGQTASDARSLIRFGTFEVDLRTGELRKAGAKLKLTGQPFEVLVILLEHAGDIVTREELQKRLWPDTFVNVEHNLNIAINKIREALGDSAEKPTFVETLPRRGYRFIAPLQTPERISDSEKDPRSRLPLEEIAPDPRRKLSPWRPLGLYSISLLVVLVGFGGAW